MISLDFHDNLIGSQHCKDNKLLMPRMILSPQQQIKSSDRRKLQHVLRKEKKKKKEMRNVEAENTHTHTHTPPAKFTSR